MVNNKKVIGVCLTKINTRSRSEYISRLQTAAEKNGYKLAVFNSVVDFCENDAYDEGARAVYSLLKFDIIDILVVMYDSFNNKEVVDGIISDAKARAVPVVLIGGESEGCYCIVKEYRQAFKELITHIIKDHGVEDTYFMAGKGADDPDSALRIECFKEVLAENNLPFSEDMIGFGDYYWALPTRRAVDKLVRSRTKLPQAIICANDVMAVAVCERLREKGYEIPRDVIVTGFDGTPDADSFSPKLTTCREEIGSLADTTMEIITGAVERGMPCGKFECRFSSRISQSCGCPDNESCDSTENPHLLHIMHRMENHEDYMYSWIDRSLDCTDIYGMRIMLSECVLPDSCVCLNRDFVLEVMKYTQAKHIGFPEKKLLAITSALNDDEGAQELIFNEEHLVPDLAQWADEKCAYIFTSLYVGSYVCGYYAARADDVFVCAHQINRIAKCVNIVFNITLDRFRQELMQRSIDNFSLIKSATGLPNLKGAVKWFNEFSSDPANHSKVLSVSIYALPKYKYIYENYGVEDIEETLRVVSDALTEANVGNCYVAHISEDEFVVVNIYNDNSEVSDTINNATSVFFEKIERYNGTSGKKFFVEVNCGCTVIDKGWEGSLEGFIKLATGEMYINRLKMGVGEAVRQETSPNDFYNVFNILLEQNLFRYHFQPIVCAKTGDIYGYEALMRTDASIGMSPFDVLETAKGFKRLYEIERATLFNVMERYSENPDKFGERNVFINSIPGFVLNEKDRNLFREKYSGYMERVVFEITEENTISDDELEARKHIGNPAGNTRIAVDDYGAGHSNIINLLRYSPQIIKIDRFLITDIDKDVNKQMFVRNTIEFARLNNIKTLAEGVETHEEMAAVISFGVDYIQGFYTGRPCAEPVSEIAGNVRKEILMANKHRN